MYSVYTSRGVGLAPVETGGDVGSRAMSGACAGQTRRRGVEAGQWHQEDAI